MPRSQSDLSNTAIRIFLQDVGAFYDAERGLEPFRRQFDKSRRFTSFLKNIVPTAVSPSTGTYRHLTI
jgi:hypothetical protein